MIGVGLIGCGYWGPNLLRNFSDLTEVVAVADLKEERLKHISGRYPAVKMTTDYEDLLHDDRIEAVVIATPVNSHFEIALGALQAGKHVFVEKPLTTSSKHAEILINEAERRNRVLMVDHTFVYTGAVRKIRELVQSGEMGDVLYYDSVRINLGLFQHDVNVIWDLAVHDLAIMDYILPHRPCAVSATGCSHLQGEPENIAYLTLFFEDLSIAHVHVNWLSPVKIRRTLIGGSKKMVVYDDLEPSEKVKVYDKGITLSEDTRYRLQVGYRAGDMWAPQLDNSEALRTEAQHFLWCIQTGEQPLTDGHAGLRLVRILEAASESINDRGKLVELEAWRLAA